MDARLDLDATDWKILRELQGSGCMTNVELARRIGISPPPCLRRVQRLERAGAIKGYRAVLDHTLLGQPVVAFCLVALKRQSESDLRAFTAALRRWPQVREAWMVSGETDFVLHCVAPDLGAFQAFVMDTLIPSPNVDAVRTALTIRQIKDEGLVPMP